MLAKSRRFFSVQRVALSFSTSSPSRRRLSSCALVLRYSCFDLVSQMRSCILMIVQLCEVDLSSQSLSAASRAGNSATLQRRHATRLRFRDTRLLAFLALSPSSGLFPFAQVLRSSSDLGSLRLHSARDSSSSAFSFFIDAMLCSSSSSLVLSTSLKAATLSSRHFRCSPPRTAVWYVHSAFFAASWVSDDPALSQGPRPTFSA